jgi:hypothetical protein
MTAQVDAHQRMAGSGQRFAQRRVPCHVFAQSMHEGHNGARLAVGFPCLEVQPKPVVERRTGL